ncbi:MAG: CDGSH iron-sulfur domain-containing protein, partial [Ferruginibacter sp.]|nr:CDGSH iron-sulfur domain-containing protein [Ferruginibacter sp.]
MGRRKHYGSKKDGSSETKEQKYFLCRCGHSQNKPYC